MPSPVTWTLQELRSRTRDDPKTGCWLWTRSTSPAGYGQVRIKSRPVPAHRLAFTLANGPVPDGIEVCHHCDTPACVNPEHLFVGSHQVNMADSFSKGRSRSPMAGKTHCIRGHLLSGENIRIGKRGKYTTRTCIPCKQLTRRMREGS